MGECGKKAPTGERDHCAALLNILDKFEETALEIKGSISEMMIKLETMGHKDDEDNMKQIVEEIGEVELESKKEGERDLKMATTRKENRDIRSYLLRSSGKGSRETTVGEKVQRKNPEEPRKKTTMYNGKMKLSFKQDMKLEKRENDEGEGQKGQKGKEVCKRKRGDKEADFQKKMKRDEG